MEGDGGDMLKRNSLQFVEGRRTLKSRSVFLAVVLQQTVHFWLEKLTYFLSDQLI